MRQNNRASTTMTLSFNKNISENIDTQIPEHNADYQDAVVEE